MHTELIAYYKACRKAQKISQGQVADTVGISMFTVSHAELGHSAPRLDTFMKMAKGINYMVAIIPLPENRKIEIADEVIPAGPEGKEINYDEYQYEKDED